MPDLGRPRLSHLDQQQARGTLVELGTTARLQLENNEENDHDKRMRRRAARFATVPAESELRSVGRRRQGVEGSATGTAQDQGATDVVASDPFRPSAVKEGIGVCKELPAGAEEKIEEIVAGMKVYFGEEVRPEAVRELAVGAYTTLDENFAEEEARAWGDGFEIPAEAVANDEALLKANGNDYLRMAEQRFQLLLKDRLNEERVREVLSAENPERDKMLSLAAGMEVPLPEGFQPNGKLNYLTGETASTYDAGDAEPLRTRYQQTASAVNKQLFKLWGLGLAFILTAQTVFWMVKADHKMVASWAAKAATEAGRVLMDPTHTKVKGGSSMNGPEVKEKCKGLHGAILHTNIWLLINHDHGVLQSGEAQRPGSEVGGPSVVEDGSASSVHAADRRAEEHAAVYDEPNRRVGHLGVVRSVRMDRYSLRFPSGDSGHPLRAAGSDSGGPAHVCR